MLYVGVVLGFLVQVILFPSYFTTEQVGIIAFVLAAANMLAAFIQFGVPSTIVKYSPKMEELGTKNRFFWASLAVPILMIGVVAGLFLAGKEWFIPQDGSRGEWMEQYYLVIGGIALCMALFGIVSAHSRTLLRTVVPNILDKVAVRFLLTILILGFTLKWLDFEGFMLGYSLVYLAIFIAMIIYFNQLRPIKLWTKEPVFSNQTTKPMLVFGLLSFLNIFGDRLVSNIDIIMVTDMLSLEAAGIYKTTFYMGAIIALPMNSLNQIVSPIYAEAWHNNDLEKVEEVYKKSSINMGLAGLLLFILIFINADNIFLMMPKNGALYSAGRNVIVLIAFGNFVSMLFGSNGHLIANSRYYYVNLISVLMLAFLTVLTNYLLIPQYGIVGAALASAVSMVLFNLIKFCFIALKYKMSPFSPKTIYIVGLVLMLVGCNYFLPTLSNAFLDTGYRSILIAIFFSVIAYLIKISPDANRMINNFLQRKE